MLVSLALISRAELSDVFLCLLTMTWLDILSTHRHHLRTDLANWT